MVSSVIGVSRPAFIVEFKEDPSGVYFGPRIKAKEEEKEQVIYDPGQNVTAEGVSASMTGRVIIKFSEVLVATEDIKLLN